MILTIVRNKFYAYESAVIVNIEVGELTVLQRAASEYLKKLQELGITEDSKLLQDTERVMDALTS